MNCKPGPSGMRMTPSGREPEVLPRCRARVVEPPADDRSLPGQLRRSSAQRLVARWSGVQSCPTRHEPEGKGWIQREASLQRAAASHRSPVPPAIAHDLAVEVAEPAATEPELPKLAGAQPQRAGVELPARRLAQLRRVLDRRALGRAAQRHGRRTVERSALRMRARTRGTLVHTVRPEPPLQLGPRDRAEVAGGLDPPADAWVSGAFSRITPLRNGIVFFPSACWHQATPVQCGTDDLEDGRWMLIGHVWRRDEDSTPERNPA